MEGVVRKDAGNGPEMYIELRIESPSLTILVPERSLEEVGVRNVSTQEEADAILAVLEAPSDVAENWSDRNASTVSRMKSTDLAQRAAVIRDLLRHRQRSGKPLSAAENRSLEHCLEMVAKELSLVLGLSESETRSLMSEKSLSLEASSESA